jgi:predicted ABC-type ATPase
MSPHAFIFAGANASGKSTFISHLVGDSVIDGEYINPDLILKTELKAEENLENYTKAFKIAEDRRYKLVKSKKNIILETVFSTDEKIDFVRHLKEEGYHVTVFFTGTESPHINATYLMQRVLSGGHDVPLRKLISRRDRGFKNIVIASNIVDCLIYVDNSVANSPPLIILSLYSGKKCFENMHFDRKVSWHKPLVENIVETILEKDMIERHVSFCDTIQNSVLTFSDTLTKTYDEKNEILAGAKC